MQETDAGVKMEQELRHQLARQAAAHSEHLQDVLRQQDQELHKKYTLLFAEKLVEESDKVRSEVQDSITRLKGIEAAIDGKVFVNVINTALRQLIVSVWGLI